MNNNAFESLDSHKILPKAISGFEHIKRYWDTDNAVYCAKILPGEYYVTRENELIVTTLGSCVSACIRDRIYGIGGMNHFMLPHQLAVKESLIHPSVSFANRYGSYAMENLINDLLKAGGKKKHLEIKVFGGGRVLSNMTDIGRRNIEFVLDYIKTESLELAAKDLGSVYPRKIIFNPKTGTVKVKKLRFLHNDTVVRRENLYLRDIQNHMTSSKVEIFK